MSGPAGLLRWLCLAGRSPPRLWLQERKAAMTTDVIDRPAADADPLLDPLIDTHLRLAPGMQVRMDRCTGDIPVMDVVNGRSVLVVGVDVAEVEDLSAEHAVLARQFARAACALADEMERLIAAREAASEG
jgi:hypothetical protein